MRAHFRFTTETAEITQLTEVFPKKNTKERKSVGAGPKFRVSITHESNSVNQDSLILAILLHDSRWLARAVISWYTSYWCKMQISMGIDLTGNGSSNLVVT